MNGLEPFKQLVYDYSGLILDGSIAEERLQQHLQKTRQLLGLSAARLLERLYQSRTELDTLISQLTVNETYFFREPEQIDLFVQQLLPRLLATAGDRPLRILSAGCSSGEEPYSLAMAILDTHGEDVLQRITIDGGDVDLSILNKARRALYSSFSFRGVSNELRDRHFDRTSEGYQLHERIRRTVRLFMLNLMAAEYDCDYGPYDVIFFRNVSIYFDLETRKNIQHRFKRIMQPDATLFLGTTETLGNDFGIFQLREHSGLYYFVKGSQVLPDTPQPVRPAPHTAIRPAPAPQPPTASDSQPAIPAQPDPQLVRQLLHEERYTEAASKLDLLLHAGQHQHPARLMQAWLLLNTGHLEQAAQLLDGILQEHPWCLDSLLARGLCYKWQQDHEGACTRFKTACYAHADSWLAQYFYGDCLRHDPQPGVARAPLQVARRILSAAPDAASGCQWLPLAPPPQDALFLIERHLLALKQGLLPADETAD